jgi:hypothetical protein
MTPFGWLKAMPIAPKGITSANCSIGWAAFAKSAYSLTYLSALRRSGSGNSCVKDMPCPGTLGHAVIHLRQNWPGKIAQSDKRKIRFFTDAARDIFKE